jgi:hypothetical protein
MNTPVAERRTGAAALGARSTDASSAQVRAVARGGAGGTGTGATRLGCGVRAGAAGGGGETGRADATGASTTTGVALPPASP